MHTSNDIYLDLPPSPKSTVSSGQLYSVSVPRMSQQPPLLPLTSPQPLTKRNFQSTSRRLSYSIRNRAGKYSIPLSVGGIITLLFITLTWSRTPTHSRAHHIKLYTREAVEQATFGTNLAHEAVAGSSKQRGKLREQVELSIDSGEGSSGGGRLLQESEEELIAEDDLFWMTYEEPPEQTAEEKAAEEELQAHRLDVINRNKQGSLRTLIWWLSEGGTIPRGYQIPTEAHLNKVGDRGMEKMLQSMDDRSGRLDDTDEGTVFNDGWAKYAKDQFRIVVFSKSYCPFSKKVKGILSKYGVTPAPYVIELDKRSDTAALQNLLVSLTGRRTAPNVLLDFESIGGTDEIQLMDAEGGLKKKFEEVGLLRTRRNRNPLIVDTDHSWTADEVREARKKKAPVEVPQKDEPAVDFGAAIKAAHREVDRREGYGDFQGKLMMEHYDPADDWIREEEARKDRGLKVRKDTAQAAQKLQVEHVKPDTANLNAVKVKEPEVKVNIPQADLETETEVARPASDTATEIQELMKRLAQLQTIAAIGDTEATPEAAPSTESREESDARAFEDLPRYKVPAGVNNPVATDAEVSVHLGNDDEEDTASDQGASSESVFAVPVDVGAPSEVKEAVPVVIPEPESQDVADIQQRTGTETVELVYRDEIDKMTAAPQPEPTGTALDMFHPYPQSATEFEWPDRDSSSDSDGSSANVQPISDPSQNPDFVRPDRNQVHLGNGQSDSTAESLKDQQAAAMYGQGPKTPESSDSSKGNEDFTEAVVGKKNKDISMKRYTAADDQESGDGGDYSHKIVTKKAPPPRHLEKDGVAALAAVGRMRRKERR